MRWRMTQEYEWAVYDKRQLHLNKEQQLLAMWEIEIFPLREKRLEFQHPNVAYFNVGFKQIPAKRRINDLAELSSRINDSL